VTHAPATLSVTRPVSLTSGRWEVPCVCADNQRLVRILGASLGSVTGKARFRDATSADVYAIMAIQEPAAVEGLGHIFPQDEHPFPRTEVAERWVAEFARPDTFVYVSTDDSERITGFAARRASELMHFGTALQTWGTGLATELHDHLVATFPQSLHVLHLFVFSENGRARRFYEKLGWVATSETRRTAFPPHPTLVRYELRRDSKHRLPASQLPL